MKPFAWNLLDTKSVDSNKERNSERYNNPQNNVSYKVITQSEKGHEVFNDFYTNKKVRPSVTSSLSEETKTNLIAHNNDRLQLRTYST